MQRKVGFEFEEMSWAPWRHQRIDGVDGPNELRDSMPAGVYESMASNQGGDRVEAVKRKEVLHKGSDYVIEGEDSSATKGATTIEVVTAPFEEDETGIARLTAAMADLSRTVDRLDRQVGRPGPLLEEGATSYPMTEREYLQNYVRPEQHLLSGSSGLPRRDLLLSGGTPGFPVVMQYTAGLPLRDIPKVMPQVGIVPGEPASASRERQRIRKHLYPDGHQDLGLRLVGTAPGKARELATRLAREQHYAPALREDRRDLLGFLTALVMTADSLQLTKVATTDDELVKYRLAQMPRNNFVQMLRAVPPAQRTAIEKYPKVLAVELAGVLDETHGHVGPDSPLIPPNTVGYDNPALVAENAALASLRISDWIGGLARGRDFLTEAGMERWLRGRREVSSTTRADAVSTLPGIGAADSVDVRRGSGQPLFQFENRKVGPQAGARRMPISVAAQHAVGILMHYAEVRRGL